MQLKSFHFLIIMYYYVLKEMLCQDKYKKMELKHKSAKVY